MGKIKGWKKVEDTTKEIVWKGKDGDKMTVAVPKNQIPSKWIAGASSMLHIRKFNNKSSAIKFATEYMRGHSNG